MAELVDIGGGKTAKVRSIWWVVVLTIVTIGIYIFFWWYFVNREMADYGRARGTTELGDSPGKSLLAITLGALVIVPAILSYINTFKTGPDGATARRQHRGDQRLDRAHPPPRHLPRLLRVPPERAQQRLERARAGAAPTASPEPAV